MQALHEQYENKGVVVLAISADKTDVKNVQEYVKKLGLTFPTLHDKSMEITQIFAVRGFPTTYILNPEGEIIGGAVGPRPWDGEEAQKLVEQLLTETDN